MKKIFLISFFLVGTISANEDVWKPRGDYFVDCSYTEDEFIVKLYAHYDLDKDKKFVTDFTTKDDDDYFSYENSIAIREYSSDTTHRFYLDKLNYWSSKSGGEMKEIDHFGRDKKVRIYRENLTMSVNSRTSRRCRIMSGEEYRTTINNLEKERDVLVQDFIEKRKSQLKL